MPTFAPRARAFEMPACRVERQKSQDLKFCFSRFSCAEKGPLLHSSGRGMYRCQNKPSRRGHFWLPQLQVSTSNANLGECRHGAFHKWWYPKMDGLSWKFLLRLMIWGYPHFRKPPHPWHGNVFVATLCDPCSCPVVKAQEHDLSLHTGQQLQASQMPLLCGSKAEENDKLVSGYHQSSHQYIYRFNMISHNYLNRDQVSVSNKKAS